MHGTLHLLAVCLTAIAVCTHPGWRGGRGALGVGSASLMLVAMIDAAYLRWVAVPLWSALLVLCAIVLSALRSPRRRAGGDAISGCAAAHDGLGLVAMAGLLLVMQGIEVEGPPHGGHGMTPGLLFTVILALVVGHAAASVSAFVQGRGGHGRSPHVLMGAATVLMAGAAVV